MKYSNRNLPKFLAVTGFALIFVGGVSAVSWNFPSDGNAFQDQFTVSVNTSGINDGNIQNVTVEMDGPQSHTEEITSRESENNWTADLSRNNDLDGTSGDYNLQATVYNGSGPDPATSVIGISLDGKSPDISGLKPEDDGFVNGDGDGNDIDVSYSVSDDFSHTSVDFNNISVDGEKSGEGNSMEVDLDDGDYTARAWANDTLGKIKKDSWDFTVDTEYDGDTNPTFANPGGGSVFELSDDEEDATFDVRLDGADSESDTVVNCIDGSGDEFDNVGPQEVDDDGTEFTCELDGDDYSGTAVDVHVEVCDEAGNCEELDEQNTTYYMDVDDPEIVTLETSSGAAAFNSNFDVDLTVTDDAAGVERVEYYFDTSVEEGDATAFNYSEDRETYEVDVSGLNNGSRTLRVRAKDRAGRWSSVETLDFDYYPNKDPSIDISHPEEVSLKAGDSTTFDITVGNTGEFFLPAVEINVSDEVVNTLEEASELQQDSEETLEIQLNSSEEDVGLHEVSISSKSPEKESSMDVIVEATEDQREELQSKFSEYRNKKKALEQNITELGVEGDRKQSLDANTSAFIDSMNQAETSIEEENYYRVKNILSDIDEDYSQASSSFEDVREEVKKERRRKLLIVGGVIGFIVLVSLIVGVLAYVEDDTEIGLYHYLPEQLRDIGLVEDIRDLINRAEEAEEEYSFDGFS